MILRPVGAAPIPLRYMRGMYGSDTYVMFKAFVDETIVDVRGRPKRQTWNGRGEGQRGGRGGRATGRAVALLAAARTAAA